MAPFAIAAIVALAIAPWSTSPAPGALVGAALGTGIAIALTLALRHRPRSGWPDAAPSLMYVLVVAMLRHGAGGAESGYSALLLLPVVAMALHGTRAHLAAVIAAAGVALAAPILVIGAPVYPDADWRRLAIVVAVAGLTGVAIQSLVGRVRGLGAVAAAAHAAMAGEARRLAAIVDAASDPIVTLDSQLRIRSWNPAATTLLGHRSEDAVGRDAAELLLRPEDAVWIRDGFAALRASHETHHYRFEIDAATATGTTTPVEASILVDPDAREFAVHVVVRDVAARRAADALAAEQLADLNELVRAAAALAELADPAAIRTLLCDVVCRLAGAEHAVLFEPDIEADLIVPTAAAGSLRVPHVALRPEASRTGRVLESGQPYFVPDHRHDPEADHEAAERMGIRAGYWQPVVRDGSVIAVLVAYWSAPHPMLPERTVKLLALLADQARTAITRAEELGRLAEEAMTDPLTGVANRRGLRDALDRAVANARVDGRPLSVALLDLDHFKAFNDEHGHLAGDELLREAAAGWAGLLRPADRLSRYGGEEFLVVLPDCDLDAASGAADRLRSAIPGGCTASAGVATWDGAEPMAGLIARADAALYRAKSSGRDRTERPLSA